MRPPPDDPEERGGQREAQDQENTRGRRHQNPLGDEESAAPEDRQ
jgi:hypothetical protein